MKRAKRSLLNEPSTMSTVRMPSSDNAGSIEYLAKDQRFRENKSGRMVY